MGPTNQTSVELAIRLEALATVSAEHSKPQTAKLLLEAARRLRRIAEKEETDD